MKTHLKNAAITTLTVLVSIYVLRQISLTKTYVDKAISG